MNKLGALLSLALLCSPLVSALDFDSAVGRFGVNILKNTVPNSAPDPVLNTLGASVSIAFADDFWLFVEPGLDLFWTNYGNYDGRAVPVEYEAGAGNNVFVLGFLLDLPLIATVRFGEFLQPELKKRFALSLSLGPAFVLRAGFKGDTSSAVADQMVVNQAAVLEYFWAEGRWFYPSAGLRFEALLQDRFTFVLGVRAFAAAANWWTALQPWYDHGMIHVMLGMRVALRSRAETTDRPEAEPMAVSE